MPAETAPETDGKTIVIPVNPNREIQKESAGADGVFYDDAPEDDDSEDVGDDREDDDDSEDTAMTGGTTITVKTSAMTGRMTMTAKVTTMTALWTRQTMAKLLMQMTVRMIKKIKIFIFRPRF